jgi:MFS family permease
MTREKEGGSGPGSLRSLWKGNVGALAGTSFLNDTASEMSYPLLPLFLVSTLGAGPAFLGVVEGIAQSTASLAKLAGGFLSDRIGRRKLLVVWGYGLASLARPLLALATAPWHVLGIRFSDRIGKGMRGAPRDALLVASVPSDRRGTAFGLHRAADHAGSVLGPLLGAGILLLAPGDLRLVFALTAIPGFLALFVLARRVREIAPGSEGNRRQPQDAPAPDTSSEPPLSQAPPAQGGTDRSSLRGLGPTFPRYLAVLLLFSLGNASDAFLVLRAEDLGVPLAALPLLWCVLHLSKMAWSVPGGALSDRWKPLHLILGGWAVYALVYAGFAVANATWQVWGLFAAYGLFFGLTESPEKALVAHLAPAHLRGQAFGVFHFVTGLGALPASLLFGALWQWKGAPLAFGTGGAIALAAAGLLPLALRKEGGHPAQC